MNMLMIKTAALYQRYSKGLDIEDHFILQKQIRPVGYEIPHADMENLPSLLHMRLRSLGTGQKRRQVFFFFFFRHPQVIMLAVHIHLETTGEYCFVILCVSVVCWYLCLNI